MVVGEAVQGQALLLAQELRRQYPSLRVLTHCGGGKYNSQLKKAYKSGARCALILEGENELDEIKARVLNDESHGEVITLDAAGQWLAQHFEKRL